MSKSKKNVVAPEPIIAEYGADTIPLVLAVGHPARARHIEWTDVRAGSCWRLSSASGGWPPRTAGLPPAGTAPSHDEASGPLRQAAHRAIAAVTDDLDNLVRFNRAVAQIYTLSNAIAGADKADGSVRREAIEALVLLSAPMMPHLAEQCWKELGHVQPGGADALAEI